MTKILHIIRSLDDPLIDLLRDDPVRPDIEWAFRVSEHCDIFVLLEACEDTVTPQPGAVVCCAYRNSVPSAVPELMIAPATTPNVAVFYTIWSYRPGSGRRLITEARSWIEQNRAGISQFVTLCPPTEMARVFHLRNGARILRVNADTVNYEY